MNLEVTSQNPSDAGVGSGLPLPRSRIPLSKMEPNQHGGPRGPSAPYQQATGGRLPYPSLTVSSASAELLLRGASLKKHLLQQQKATLSPHRSPAATARTDGTCSAYSSPQVPRRDTLRSKDTLDLRTSALTQKALRDLQLRRNVNQNWTFGKYRVRSVDNADHNAAGRLSAHVQQGPGRGRLPCNKGANGNEIPGLPSGGGGDFLKDTRNLSNRGLASDVEVSGSFYPVSNTPHRGRVNMAAVAPFRFR